MNQTLNAPSSSVSVPAAASPTGWKPGSSSVPAIDPATLEDPSLYLNRELTWLEFNSRVLHEAEDERTPLLERVKFLAILSSNLDEFFMKRIGGLKQLIGAGVNQRSVDGRTPEEQIIACYEKVRALKIRQRKLAAELHDKLAEAGIRVSRYQELTAAQQEKIREHYIGNIFPLVTPMGMDPAHPFPFISNLSLNILVSVQRADGHGVDLVRIKVPLGPDVDRFLRIGEDEHFVPLEDVIANNIDLLLPDATIDHWDVFRVTRNAIVERDEEQANDLLEMIESELRDRKFAPTVRLEVSAGMRPEHSGMLAAELGLDEDTDVFVVDGLMQKRDLMELMAVDRPELKDSPHAPVDHPMLASAPNLFHLIRREGPILLQHPYESFATSVERFLMEASRDPKVLAIKMTLYRTASKSKIIQHLIEAASRGKQVAVAVELKARFDEAANVHWANRLEEAGIHVSYGILGLKTHSKVVFVLRKDYDGLRRYAHLGTGNYHSGTARLYSDLGLLTCDPVIGSDLTELFNFLTTGYSPRRRYRKLLPAPTVLKPALLDKIRREIGHARRGEDTLIRFKMNALEDPDMCRALYEAAASGVRVQLIIRDTCRVRPGLPGLTDSLSVISIVGRFLEHTRIFHFLNAGDEEYYIGSADCMRRNLESRVETVFPVEPPELRAELDRMLTVQLADQRSAWDMHSDGTYTQRTPGPGDDARSAQEIFIDLAHERARAAAKSVKKKRRKMGG
jgi:polyphosphate kinase